ncbi:hypothetical protein BH11PSE11_BH11PSE11_12950 [soil metagenome]
MSTASKRHWFLAGSIAAAISPSCFAAEPTATAVEFYHTTLKHYFMTANPAEAVGIDNGAAGAGWVRTGVTFKAFLNASDDSGLVAVCRFYGTPGKGPNSHFYTADSAECAGVKNDPGWTYEGIAFYIKPLQNGACASGSTAVYRSYNNGYATNNSNHRYLTDYTLFANMPAQGYAPEAAVMCSPLAAAQKQADANRLLQQASFGPTDASMQRVLDLGVQGWLNEQFAATKTEYPSYPYVAQRIPASCVNNSVPPITATSYCQRDNYSLFQTQLQFYRNALVNPDQLRQRVAFALSQILVTSGIDVPLNYGMARYQQIFLDNAFGNYEDVLTAVTLSPQMGEYLNMVNNDKPNAASGYNPNENYARELLQLFSIGLYKLNLDGTTVLDAKGNPVPTYAQAEVTNLSHVMTGWTFPVAPGGTQPASNFVTLQSYTANMVPLQNHHDTTSKILLDGVLVPAGLDISTDLSNAVHLVFMHPNVGPFIGKQLIQKLVNGNPSPGYVARVAAVFNNNGAGVRGDLKAVVSAILLDPEARGDVKLDPNYGKLREPVLFATTIARALGAASDGVYFQQQLSGLGQHVFYSPTVFNYYSPSYTVPGTTILGPEFDLQDTSTAISRINFAYNLLNNTIAPSAQVYGATGTQLDWTALQALAADPSALADKLSALFLNGSMSAQMKSAIVTAVTAVSATNTLSRARTAVYLVAASPQFQVER